MIQFLKIIQAIVNSLLWKNVLWHHTEQMPSYWINKYFFMLKIFDCRGIVMEINQIVIYGTSDGNMKYNFIHVFTRNVSLKQHAVKTVFSCIDISSKPVFPRTKYFSDHADWTLNLDINYFVFFFFFDAVYVSPTFFSLILTICENNLYSRPICWMYFSTRTGRKWEKLNSCFHFNRELFWKINIWLFEVFIIDDFINCLPGFPPYTFFQYLPVLYLSHLHK